MEERIQEGGRRSVPAETSTGSASATRTHRSSTNNRRRLVVDSRVMLAGRHPSRDSSLSVAVRQRSLGGEAGSSG